MSMRPFFPSLKPPIANCIWFEVDPPCNEETEVTALEREQHAWLNSITNAAADIHPLGKVVLTMAGPETDEEDVNEDSEDSDSHDEEDEDEIDRIIATVRATDGMDITYSPDEANTTNNEDGQPQNVNN